ncbi:hypothetical protein FZEAL_3567 [Fusarium zealandicum]|uniref:Dienelactone hydrolase domain-containing protein n=1 Tax=Fusarium zealandicum TaxID=1053134 RepID=A0A8H4UNZ3_9HYPO|nr:hypothetical protein FZEAL_3567 [Fusarium zealandicum]
MASNQPAKCCTVGVRHEGEPAGKSIRIANNSIEAYVATPSTENRKDVGILYLPDIWGICTNSQLMADQFAANGYTCLIPDLFNGDKFPEPTPAGFDVMGWIAKGGDGNSPHTPEALDPIVVEGIKALKELGLSKIGAAGYCYGAKCLIRHYKTGIQVGYAAHPSFVDEDELAAITGPFAISAAQTDPIFPAAKRHRSEEILIETGLPFQINLYAGVEHGFAVRGNPKVKAERFAKEQAFYQAVAWFDEHL